MIFELRILISKIARHKIIAKLADIKIRMNTDEKDVVLRYKR